MIKIKRFYLLLTVSLCISFIGCAKPHTSFVNAVHTSGTFVATQLIEYIEKDKIEDKSKETRINSVKLFLRMLKEEKNRVNGEKKNAKK